MLELVIGGAGDTRRGSPAGRVTGERVRGVGVDKGVVVVFVVMVPSGERGVGAITGEEEGIDVGFIVVGETIVSPSCPAIAAGEVVAMLMSGGVTESTSAVIIVNSDTVVVVVVVVVTGRSPAVPVVLGGIANRPSAVLNAGEESSVTVGAVGAVVVVVTEEEVEEGGRAVCAEERDASTDRIWEAGP